MVAFALITEGITDQAVLESILIGHYSEEPEFRQLQPPRDATDESRQGAFAGWERVLEYCGLDDFELAFSTNDYVIVHLDCDICQHPTLNIALTSGGGDRTAEEVIHDVKSSIISRMQPGLFLKYSDRIIFAIAYHSIECWLIPLYTGEKKKASRVKNCENHLRQALEKMDIRYSKDYRTYQAISKGFEKQKNHGFARLHNKSLDIFLSALPPTVE